MAGKKILIIDDDTDILDSIQAIVESSGYTAITASGGKEGLARYAADKPDLILCDMMMESIDEGIKVASEIRKNDNKIVIYLLSSIGDATAGTIDPNSLGFSGVFQKPVEPKTLLAALEKALA